MVFYVLAISHVHVIKEITLKTDTIKRQVVFGKFTTDDYNRIHSEEKPDKFIKE